MTRVEYDFGVITPDNFENLSKLTEFNIETLLAIDEYFQKENWMPSVRDLMSELGLNSTSVVIYRLRNLEKLNLIKREPKRAKLAITDFGKFVLTMARDEELIESYSATIPSEHG